MYCIAEEDLISRLRGYLFLCSGKENYQMTKIYKSEERVVHLRWYVSTKLFIQIVFSELSCSFRMLSSFNLHCLCLGYGHVSRNGKNMELGEICERKTACCKGTEKILRTSKTNRQVDYIMTLMKNGDLVRSWDLGNAKRLEITRRTLLWK